MCVRGDNECLHSPDSGGLLRGAHLCPGGGGLCGCNQVDKFHRRGQRLAGLASRLAELFVRYALFAFVIVTIALVALHRIVNSPAGRVVQAIHQNERRARQIGYNTNAYRALMFIISGAFSGLAGALYSPFIQFVSPDLLFWTFSGQVIIMTIIGGSGAFYGPVLGTAVFVILRDFISSWSASSAVIGGVALAKLGEHWPLFMGMIFFLIIVFEPTGLIGIIARFKRARRVRSIAANS
jgi:ABC-type branched-subunit amino acid transport system permease subunit